MSKYIKKARKSFNAGTVKVLTCTCGSNCPVTSLCALTTLGKENLANDPKKA